MAKTRTAPQARETETREASDRPTQYRPPSNLPDPTPQDGYVFRWVRTDMLGKQDNRNVSMRQREGWEPCLSEDHPELLILSDTDTTFEGNIVIGGLMLCKCLEETMALRADYYANQAKSQRLSVDQNYMRESDPRMPVLPTEIKSSVSFGAGRRR